ncbi:MAG: hypothetical protein B6I28_02830 [Fusobacteriia bacterium 4572_132]|nr:MAG: hypothetical protein B6I28_02830 [Fusobacteriia bacterium 4572_132]
MSVKKGDIIEGKVEKLTNYGAFVNIGEEQTGLVHISEVDNSYVKKIEDFLKIDQIVKVKVLEIKEKGKIDLSIKAIQEKKPTKFKFAERNKEKEFNNFNTRKPVQKSWTAKREVKRNQESAIKTIESPKPLKVNFEDKLSDFLKNSEEKHNTINRRLKRD